MLFVCCDRLVVGDKEKAAGTVNVRTRDNKILGERSLDQLVIRFKELNEKKILNSEEPFN